MNKECYNCGVGSTPLWRRDANKNIVCNACGIRSNKNLTYKKLYECLTCNSFFLTTSGLLKHKKSHNNVKYKCQICNRNFLTYNGFKSHSNSHRLQKTDDIIIANLLIKLYNTLS